MALALYRRYRPDTFDGVVGQDQVTVPLTRALDANKLTHAYLFSGPRGCGKTSSARILARCINCVKGPTSHPCGVCDSCRDLANGGPGSIDVVEIDAASHNGVEDARELRDRAGFAPARDRYKIFILDEAHMVTPQGFNALLKIVEEPPEHVMFIFATTEPERVIGTIRSRTHHYPFRLVPPEIMGPYLEDICKKEEVEAEPGVLRLAMRAGGGSVRDTLSVLDQLMVGAVDGVMTYDSAVGLLGFTPDVLISEAIDAVINRDGTALYGVIQKVIVGGFDARRFVEDLLAYVRDLLVLTLGGDKAESVLSDDASEHADDLHRQASELGLQAISAMAETIDQTLSQMVGAISPRMRLELLAARLLAAREPGALQVTAPAVAAADPAADTHSKAPMPHGGFIGAKHNDEPKTHDAQQTAQSQPQHGAWAQSATSSQHDSWAQPASTQQTTPAAQPAVAQETSAPAAEPVQGTPDERWDALVASLPDQVRDYVDRVHVPRINLSTDLNTGEQRLWIKFDTPLSKYAFALAVSSEAVHGTNRVQDILRAKVHEIFGQQVSLAPTQKMANGEFAPPVSRLSQDELKKIKAQVMQRDLKAVTSDWNTGHTAHESVSHETSTSDSATTSSSEDHGDTSSDADHAASAAAVASSVDPWATPIQGNAASMLHPQIDLNDPWAQPIGQSLPAPQTSSASQPQQHNAVEHTVTAAQQESDDPWAQSQTHGQFASSNTGFGSAAQSQQDIAEGPEGDPYGPDGAVPPAQGAGQNMPGLQNGPQMPTPQVDAEHDVYSLDDQDLDGMGAVGIDELKRMFEVKSEQDFAADDPGNPHNQHAHKNLD
ncbi:DNA polymerase III subunit gamma/tau [Bifidobacterium dolichotidis]|uniref:DNA-directed DNA polymerase n=1 Tax=Bifidobacterium dolichotidis TaxID=2306976 RepID=A0A430FQR5_9BIFI|nr:DNA polymerase III subunit gamma/tau [Bifidobacterium dolichotidis]RSX55156.1 DNA polymerase III subunit gamma/tau [Bifidobacterium dolichotidis]